MLLALMIALPVVGAFLPLAAGRFHRSICTISTAVPPIAALAILLSQRAAAMGDAPVLFQVPWIPEFGLNFSLRLDGLSYMFAILVLLIGLLVILYAHYYLSEKERIGRFFSYLLLFMGSMLGVVLSGNLLLLVVFWELTSLSSFLLIGFWSHSSEARKGARMALTVTGMGGLALLAGALLIGQVVGSFEFDAIFASADLLRASATYPIILVLVLVGAFTKSAQFPFHFWLPHAMAAPTPVSAYLHSATMVKAGVFLLARMHPALAETDLWFIMVSLAGLVTLLLGGIMAMYQRDLKGLLAYSTVSHLGLITLLLGLNTELSIVAALFHVVNHATFKASLFMAAGIVDHETGTRDMRRLSGLRHYMPFTFALALVASLAMAGVPLLNGFLSKEMFFAETLDQHVFGSFSWIIPLFATIASMFSVGYSLRLVVGVFMGPRPTALPIYPPGEAPRYMRAPIEILVVLCVLVGVFPGFIVGDMLYAASRASLGHAVPAYSLSIWHGFNIPLLMSASALVGGGLVYRYRKALFAWSARFAHIDAKHVFEGSLQWLARAARKVLRFFIARESFRWSSVLALVTTAALVGPALLGMESIRGPRALSPLEPVTSLGMVVMAMSTLLTARFHKNRRLALMTMGVAGTMVALVFARFSAPDLALTQISVEVATLVLLMLALYYIPMQSPRETPLLGRVVRVALSVGTGAFVSLLTFSLLTRDNETISGYYMANALPGGGGTNVVNVILVDFRGYDTMGEIVVLTLAGLGIMAMLTNLKLFQPPRDEHGRNWAKARHPLVLVTLARVALPFAMVVCAHIFLRGHNLPGGGFIAGLITACALILQYSAAGTSWVEERLPVDYARVAGAGVAIAGLTGLASMLFGHNFLTSAHVGWDVPILGHIELSSALGFDLGVYLAVVGAAMLILTSLGKLSLIGEREETS